MVDQLSYLCLIGLVVNIEHINLFLTLKIRKDDLDDLIDLFFSDQFAHCFSPYANVLRTFTIASISSKELYSASVGRTVVSSPKRRSTGCAQ